MKQALASLRRLAVRCIGLSALAAAATTTPAHAQTRIVAQPYVEATQVFSVGLDDGDASAYTGLAAGIDVSATTRRLEGQLSYRYEKRIGWDDNSDNDIHNGLAQMRATLLPGTLQFSAGALASRARSEGVGPIFNFSGVDDEAVAEVYAVYAGPDFHRQIGGVDIAASYRLGYVHIDDHRLRDLPIIPGQVLLDRFNESVTHSATASVGQGVGPLPFGWTIGGGYVREDVDRLDQQYEAVYVRGDVVVPISHSLALTAGVGYERIESSQQDILRNAAGLPIITPGGNFIADPSKPRLRSFDTDGMIYDAGFIWRPSRRTELQGRVGHRYGGTTIIGSFKHDFNSAYGITVNVYDGIESFGRMVVTDLDGVPVRFHLPESGLAGPFGIGGCVFGTEPGTGTCFNDAFQSLATNNFRNRGVNVILSGERGPWNFGLGASYNHRRYFVPVLREQVSSVRVIEESFTLFADASRRLSPTSGVQASLFAATGDNSLPNSERGYGLGLTGTYYQRVFTDKLQGTASVGLFHSGTSRFDRTVASFLVGLRYNF
jgi:hypothetical protein